jgi:tetratricopeptide (TPR) repeat protein
MSPAKRKQIDPLEKAIEAALSPGRFISYDASWSFVEDVQGVADDISGIIRKEPVRAARLYEIFIAACHEKAEEVDDSSGNFGMLVEELFQGWMNARQAANCDPDETAMALISWMEDDPYGFCHDLDREVVKVLDKKGLEAFVQQIRLKLESSPIHSDEEEGFPGYARRRWGEALKTLLAAQRNVDAFIELCEQTELEARDCLAIAKMYKSRRRPEEALAWVDRGLKIARSERGHSSKEYELRDLKRTLQVKIGRPTEALQSAWTEFEARPSTFSYKELMRYVPDKEKTEWREKAMTASENGDLSSLIELWLEQKEFDRLVARLHQASDDELEALSHFQAEPLARKLERSHPDLAARVYRALCMRIVNVGKSKYYDAALGHIEHAKKCYSKAGLDAHWQAVVDEVRKRHSRKKGFMAGFEEIVTDALKQIEPSFLDRAKARWPRKPD